METVRRKFVDAFAGRYARSGWRLPVLLVGATIVCLLPLYLVRGVRLVRMAVAGVAALTFAIAAFERPFQAMLLALFIGYSGLSAHLPIQSIVAAFLLILLARLAWDCLDGARLELGPPPILYAFGVLVAAALASMLVASSWSLAGSQARLVVIGVLWYAVLSHFASSASRVVGVVAAIATGMAFGTLVVVRQLSTAGTLDLLRLLGEARFGGIGGDPNVEAAWANCLLPPMVHCFGRTRGWRRVGVALVVLSLIAAIILSQSRGGMAMLGVILLVLVLRERAIRPYAITAFVLFGIGVALLPRIYWVRFVSLGQLSGIIVDRSLQLRRHLIEVGWQTFLDHPILGVGLGNFGVHAQHRMLGDWHAHNTYLELAATLGFVGVSAYVAMLVIAFLMTRDAGRRFRAVGRRHDGALADALGISLVAFALLATTLSIGFFLMFWLLLGLTNALHRAARTAEPPLRAVG